MIIHSVKKTRQQKEQAMEVEALGEGVNKI